MLGYLLVILVLIECFWSVSWANNEEELTNLISELNPPTAGNRFIDNKDELDKFCKSFDDKYNRAVKLADEVYVKKTPTASEMLKLLFIDIKSMKDHCKDEQSKKRFLKAAGIFNAKTLSGYQRLWRWVIGSLDELVKKNKLNKLTAACFHRKINNDIVKMMPTDDDDAKQVLFSVFQSTLKNNGGDNLDKNCADVQLPEPGGGEQQPGHRNSAIAIIDATT